MGLGADLSLQDVCPTTMGAALSGRRGILEMHLRDRGGCERGRGAAAVRQRGGVILLHFRPLVVDKGEVRTPLKCVAYPAATPGEAEARAAADAEEHAWEVVAADWVPSRRGDGGVLVVQVEERQPTSFTIN